MATFTLAEIRAARGTTLFRSQASNPASKPTSASACSPSLATLQLAIARLDSGFNHLNLSTLIPYLCSQGYSRELVIGTIQAARRANLCYLERAEGRYGITQAELDHAIDGCHTISLRK